MVLSWNFTWIPPEIDDTYYINGLNTLSSFKTPNKMFKTPAHLHFDPGKTLNRSKSYPKVIWVIDRARNDGDLYSLQWSKDYKKELDLSLFF